MALVPWLEQGLGLGQTQQAQGWRWDWSWSWWQLAALARKQTLGHPFWQMLRHQRVRLWSWLRPRQSLHRLFCHRENR